MAGNSHGSPLNKSSDMMRFYYSDSYALPLPDGHRFPGDKYRILRERLLSEDILRPDQLVLGPFAQDADILRAHDENYVRAFESGELGEKEMRRIGFPWHPAMVKRARATMGGAVEAAKSALETGLSGLLAGGTHHAHRDFGSGYCVYNDHAISALWAVATGEASKVLILDLDVHQGDGNAAILADHPDVFVFSMHGERNFPFRKVASDMDVALPDQAGDDLFLSELTAHLPGLLEMRPDLILYQAGVDGLAEDRLGRLSLSLEGLIRRDEMVLGSCFEAEIPVAMSVGGGYTDPIDLTIEAYVNTYRVAKSIYGF